MTQTMIEARGADYVTGWPAGIAKNANLGEHRVLEAVKEITGKDIEDHITGAADPDRTLEVIGALDGPTAKAIIRRAIEIDAEWTERTKNNCHYCGLPMRNGVCEECV